MSAKTASSAPYHAHIYYTAEQRPTAVTWRDRFIRRAGIAGHPPIVFVGPMTDAAVGPHPIPQFEIHFLAPALATIIADLEASGLRVLIHPLTDNDLADHTRLGHWIGKPLVLDLTVLDPPGQNRGVPRFGKAEL